MARYLAEHPSVYLCEPKEPYFLATELRSISAGQFGIRNFEDYHELFAKSDPERHSVVGEATTLYLSSDSAPQVIAKNYPTSKLVAMIRDPTDVAHAFHMQMCLSFRETIEDFDLAWRACEDRRSERGLSNGSAAQRLLLYDEIPAFGKQLMFWLSHFPPEQMLVIDYSEFCSDPSATYRQVLRFLELPDDGRSEFQAYNSSNVHRFRLLNKIYVSGPCQRVLRKLKAMLPEEFVNQWRQVPRNVLRRNQPRPRLSDELRAEISSYFESDYATALRHVNRAAENHNSS